MIIGIVVDISKRSCFKTRKTILKRNSKGFTLIELMIVIAVIGIISSIAIPNYIIYKKDTEQKADEVNARNIVLAIKLEVSKGTKLEDITKNGYKKIADGYFNGAIPKSQYDGTSFIIDLIDKDNITISTKNYKLYP